MTDLPRRLGVVGAGTMGAGIAQLGWLAGGGRVLHDPSAAALEKGAAALHANIDKGADRGRWSQDDAAAAHERLSTAEAVEGLEGSEFVIEAAPEKLELKTELFDRLGEICGHEA